MNRTTTWLLAAAVGVAVGAATFAWLVPDLALAGTSALFWTVAVGLSTDHHRARWWSTGGGGRARWSGAVAGLATLAATIGVSPSLSVSSELRFALGLLVLGVAVTMVNLGMGMTLATDEGETDGAADAAPGD